MILHKTETAFILFFHNYFVVHISLNRTRPADHPFRRALLIGFQEVYMKEKRFT